MVKDILVSESLSDSMITAGAKLIGRLDEESADVKSAYWLYFSEDKIWKLIIASPLVDSEGPRKYYRKVVAANELAIATEETVSLNDIAVTNTTNEIVQLIKFAISTGNDISGVRFAKNTINGVFIEDAYIYRSNL